MSRPTRHPCGCTSNDRAWVSLCDKHRAEHAELHERAAREHATPKGATAEQRRPQS